MSRLLLTIESLIIPQTDDEITYKYVSKTPGPIYFFILCQSVKFNVNLFRNSKFS